MQARTKGYLDISTGDTKVPTIADIGAKLSDNHKKIVALNTTTCQDLVFLCNRDVSFSIKDGAIDADFPTGNASVGYTTTSNSIFDWNSFSQT